jgi:hypothetical protein
VPRDGRVDHRLVALDELNDRTGEEGAAENRLEADPLGKHDKEGKARGTSLLQSVAFGALYIALPAFAARHGDACGGD